MTSHGETTYGHRLTRTAHWKRSALTSGPAVAWLSILLLGPMLAVLVVSFMSRGDYGELSLPLTLENYKRLLGFGLLGFDPLYPRIVLRSLAMGAATVILCIAAGLPLAFFIGRQRPMWRNVALVLVVIPFWTNLLIRTYAWQMLLSPNGWIPAAIRALGLPVPDEGFYPGMIAVSIGMVCDFLPFMVLPLYASVEKIDWALAEAAMDLGANRFQAFRHAVMPQILPGLYAGAVLVALPAIGHFVIPDLLGGAKTMMLGNAIQQQFGPSRDWPFGSAMAVIALLLVFCGMILLGRKTRNQPGPIL